MLTVLWTDMGVLSYRKAWQLQQALMDRLKSADPAEGSVSGYLLLVEHPHVYTLGRNGNRSNMLASAAQLKARQAELVEVDRGGDITYHGPGQLVVYPIVRLGDLGIGVREYVHRLEEVVVRTVGAYGVAGGRMEKAAGVWLDAATPAARKICAIGIRCSHGVTMHGFALNVSADLTCFGDINPCGFADRGVTSLEKETGRKVDMEGVKMLVRQRFSDVFGVALSEKISPPPTSPE
ncbi:MAG: lipoyl(octanoyl) transferase LipB [Prevotellaceae bacterium]|jgi:lipoyl(octanoyl) transferase|nr:lipoyl(octanoyl) transferase LipB [Prevotellaceae bacterium]